MAAVSSSWTCSFIFLVHGSTMVIQSSGIWTGGNLPESKININKKIVKQCGISNFL